MGMVLRSVSSSAFRRLRSLSSIATLSPSTISSSSSSSTASIREISSSSRFLSFDSPETHQMRALGLGLPFRRALSGTTSQLPQITDSEIASAFKDLMAMSWDEIPDSVISNTKKALSKSTEDEAGQKALANVFRAAEACVEFGGVLVSLRMALDDLTGVTGEVCPSS